MSVRTSPYLCLGIASPLMIVSNWAYTVPAAAWLYPVFLMRFMRCEKAAWGLLWGSVTCMAAGMLMCGWALSQEMLFSPAFRMLSGAASGLLVFLPFAADRLAASRLSGIASTLVFPMACVSTELLMSFDGYRSTWGSVAYTQYGNLPLVQVVSVTGIWGVTFLVAWFASVVNRVWEEGFHGPASRTVLLYAGVVAAVLVGGGLNLALFPPHGETTRVATITKPQGFHSLFPLTETRESLCADSLAEQGHFMEKTREAAGQGARVILWQEMAVFIPSEDESVFIRRMQEVAAKEKIYVAMTTCSYPGDYPAAPWINQVTLLGPSGAVLAQYLKARPSVLEPIQPGDGQVPVIDTPYGRIAVVICCDATFPGLIRQAGRGGAGLLLVPGLVWPGVDPLYTRMNTFRAVENGFSFLQATGQGLSAAVDRQGRVLSAMDYGRTASRIMITDVPIRHVPTAYTRMGDLFGWVCAAGFLASVTCAVFRPSSRKPRN